jgi:dTDP-4-dehydrorhamnose 3,5-epimerase
MNVIETKLKDVYLLEPRVFGDNRGWFMESWSKRVMDETGLNYEFVQDNHSYSAQKGTLRGIHYQHGKYAQAKLVRCVSGAVLDYTVDLRKGSPTYLQWIAAELSAENKRQLLIPRGFGHAFLTLTDDVEFLYKADNYYEPKADRSIRWNDPDIGIEWATDNLILSEKDKNAPLFKDSNVDFVYGGM